MTLDELNQVAERFVRFADETRGSSLLYTALSREVARDRELLELLLAAPPTQRRANLVFAAVHDLLLSGHDHSLARYYPSVTVTAQPPDEAVFPVFRDFCLSRQTLIRDTIAVRQTQTNEVRRSIAFAPVFQRLSASGPIALVEVGASAGLNLLVDQFRYRYGEEPWVGKADSTVAIHCELRGAPPPLRPDPPQIAFRVGLDSHPLDVRNSEDARWLMACVWPEQIDRLELLRSALDVAHVSPPRIIAGDAVGALEEVVAEVPDHLEVCLFHSATVPYLTEAALAAFVSTIDRLGRHRRLHWLSLEGGGVQSFGARLPFSDLSPPRPSDRPTDIFGLLGYASWTGGKRDDQLLARVDMHGRWLEWLAP